LIYILLAFLGIFGGYKKMHKNKKNHKFFSGKNHIVKHQDNSRPFYNVNQNDNVSFINARRNKRNFNEQNNNSFGTSPNSPPKQMFSQSFNKNRSHNGNSRNKQNQQPNFQQPNKSNNNKNQKPLPQSYQPQKSKYQNPEIEKFLSTFDVKNQVVVIQAITDNFLRIDLQKLHAIDEKLLEEAIITNNKEIVELAIIAYSYRKLISKKHIFYSPNWKKFKDKAVADLKLASELSKKPDHTEYNKKIKEIETDIESTDKLLGHFIHDIVYNARAKLASSAYASGLSLSQATSLLSADKDSVMELIGQTKIPDEETRVIGKTLKEKVAILKQIAITPKSVIKK